MQPSDELEQILNDFGNWVLGQSSWIRLGGQAEGGKEYLDRIQALIDKQVVAVYNDIIQNVTKPETIGAHFLHTEVEEFAKQLEEYLQERIAHLQQQKGEQV